MSPLRQKTSRVVGVCVCANGPLLYYAHRATRSYVGPVQWVDGGVSLVWTWAGMH